MKFNFSGGDSPTADPAAAAVGADAKHETETPAHPVPRHLAAVARRLPVAPPPPPRTHVSRPQRALRS